MKPSNPATHPTPIRLRLRVLEALTLGGRPNTFTAKRCTFTYTRTRTRFDHEKMDVDLIERENEVREKVVVYGYGYVNENGNEGDFADGGSRGAGLTGNRAALG